MTHPSHPFRVEALCPVPLGLMPTTGTLSPWALRPLGDPVVVGHTHWDWSSSNPALPLRGLTRERLSALDAGPHVASSACCCPLNPFGRRSADRFTRLLPAGSGLSRQDQTNLCHGAPLRRSHRRA